FAALIRATIASRERMRARLDVAHLYRRAGFDAGESFHVAECAGEDVARARKPSLITLADRRAAISERNAVPFRPVGNLTGCNHGARAFLDRDLHGDREIDLFTPRHH